MPMAKTNVFDVHLFYWILYALYINYWNFHLGKTGADLWLHPKWALFVFRSFPPEETLLTSVNHAYIRQERPKHSTAAF